MADCILVGLGGFIGTVCRYAIGLLPVRSGSQFPFKTLLINVLGAFVISFIVAVSVKNESLNPHVTLMLKVGVCGGFTTFSTFAYESASLMQSGHTATAVLYIIVSAVMGVLAVYAAQVVVH